MATALRQVSHEDRLSLVEHLTELRVRIVICLVAFIATTALCMWQNQRVLDVLNKPLTETVSKGAHDPLTTGSVFNRGVADYIKQSSSVQRRFPPTVADAQVRRALLALATGGEKLAASVPEVASRR